MLCPSCRAENPAGATLCRLCGRALEELVAGTLFASRYEILAPLGRGGMGAVFKALDRELDEVVALKVLRADVAGTPEMERRFRSEIKLARRVSHRNVCRLHDYGEAQGLRYVCMAYVEGHDLKRLLEARGALPQGQAFDVCSQVADGLQAIHDEGIVHRDLKSANIMLDARGVARLMDFGIAKAVEGGATHGATATGVIVGTPEYMSPEQALGRKVDTRSDLYALGIVIFEAFTGRVPFRGDTPIATILQHVQQAPPLDGPAAAGLPPAVVGLLRRALAKEPAERPASAREMAEALRAAWGERGAQAAVTPVSTPTLPAGAVSPGGGRATVAPPPTVARPASRPSLWLAAAGGLAVLAGLPAGLWWLGGRQPESPPAPGGSLEATSVAAPSTVPSAAAETRPVLAPVPTPTPTPTAAPQRAGPPATLAARSSPPPALPAPAAAPLAAPAEEQGWLVIVAVPWADVSVDGAPLDGAWHEQGGELCWRGLSHLNTSEVGGVLEKAVLRMARYLRRRGLLGSDEDDRDQAGDPESALAASAVSGQTPPAGPQWLRGLAPLEGQTLAYDKPLCASLDEFTLDAATRAGALDLAGREALLRYVLRPPIAQERLEQRPDGLVRITLKKAYSDGTVAVEQDPLSLLCRLAACVPPPRFHTVRYAGLLAGASPWRSRLAPTPPGQEPAGAKPELERTGPSGGYRPWAEHPRPIRRHPRGRERLLHPEARPALREELDPRHPARDHGPRRRLHCVGQEGLPDQHRRPAGLQGQRCLGPRGRGETAALRGWRARRRAAGRRPGRHGARRL